jgi:iron-sulfur cluster repair protein YtfE (RIC family)
MRRVSLQEQDERMTPSNSDPVRQLIDEHEMFMEALEELSAIMASVSDTASMLPPSALRSVEEVWRSVNEHLNVHFVKEEEVFFPLIERLFPGARVKFQFLHMDHEKLRENFEEFTCALQDYRLLGQSATAVAVLRRVSAEMIRLFYYHIIAEDTIYFEVAGETMSESESAEALYRMAMIESRLREDIMPAPETRLVRGQ